MAFGQVDREAAALAGPTVDGEAPAHRRDQTSRLECADPEAAILGRGERLKQAGADELAVHSRPRVDDRDGDLAANAAHANRDDLRRGAGIDRILEQVSDRLFEQ